MLISIYPHCGSLFSFRDIFYLCLCYLPTLMFKKNSVFHCVTRHYKVAEIQQLKGWTVDIAL